MATEAQDSDPRDGDEKTACPVAQVETEDTPREGDQPRQQQRRLPSLNVLVNFAGVVAVVWGVMVAKDTLDSIKESVDVAQDAVKAQADQLRFSGEQLALSREQFTATRDGLRVEQRAWLEYAGFTMQSKKNTASDPWENREISDSGDIYRFRVSVVNNGRTPALNVTLSTGMGTVAFRIGQPPTEWRTPDEAQRGMMIMPGEQGRYLYTPGLLLHPAFAGSYMNGSARMFLWTRLQYCDVYQRRHSALIAVARQAGSDPDGHFTIPEQRLGPADGEPDHPACKNIFPETP